jgi:hypothetical protein
MSEALSPNRLQIFACQGLKRAGIFVPFAALAFLAVLVQGFVVQTHIHIPQGAGKAQTVSLITLAAAAFADKPHAAGDTCADTPRDKYPINGDPLNCPLCQETVHCGEYVQSAAAAATLPPSANIHFVVFAETLPLAFRASHFWRGRAPPIV